MWRDTVLVAGKDLRIETRSRVALSQVAPFGIGGARPLRLALGPDHQVMAKGAPGLFWVAVLFCTVLAIQRSVVGRVGRRRPRRAAPVRHRSRRPLPGQACTRAPSTGRPRVPPGRRRDPPLRGPRRGPLDDRRLLACFGTIGLAATGTLYGALSAGLRVRGTLLPFLLLPIAAPVLLAGTKIWQAALAGGNYGYAVATYGNYVVVSNPDLLRWNPATASLHHSGTVDVFLYNRAKDEHDYVGTLYQVWRPMDVLMTSEVVSASWHNHNRKQQLVSRLSNFN